MASVTESDVRNIFDTGLSTAGIEAYIPMGEKAAENAVAAADESIPTSDEDTLAAMLTVHFASASDPTSRQSATADTEDSFERPTNNPGGLRETRFGRRAVEFASLYGINLVAVIEETDKAAFESIGIHR